MAVSNVLAQHGWDVTGVDPSTEGIAQANAQWPQLKLYEGSAYITSQRSMAVFRW